MRRNCPVCNNHDLGITQLSCSNCGLSLIGKFATSPLARLAGEETKLAVLMKLCGVNLKQLAHNRSDPWTFLALNLTLPR